MPGIRLAELHPILVHFPIALLATSVACDVLGTLLKRWGLLEAATWCLLLGVPFAALAILAGQITEGAVDQSKAANILHLHKLYVGGGSALFGVLLILRLVWLAPRLLAAIGNTWPAVRPTLDGMQGALRLRLPGLYADRPPALVWGLYLALSLGAMVLLAIGGYYGGALVYDYGVLPR